MHVEEVFNCFTYESGLFENENKPRVFASEAKQSIRTVDAIRLLRFARKDGILRQTASQE